MFTKEVWLSWRNSPTTKEFFEKVQDLLVANADLITHGVTLGENTGEMTARVVGRIESLRAVIEYSPDFDEERDNA